jgi:hypothetical protein
MLNSVFSFTCTSYTVYQATQVLETFQLILQPSPNSVGMCTSVSPQIYFLLFASSLLADATKHGVSLVISVLRECLDIRQLRLVGSIWFFRRYVGSGLVNISILKLMSIFNTVHIPCNWYLISWHIIGTHKKHELLEDGKELRPKHVEEILNK